MVGGSGRWNLLVSHVAADSTISKPRLGLTSFLWSTWDQCHHHHHHHCSFLTWKTSRDLPKLEPRPEKKAIPRIMISPKDQHDCDDGGVVCPDRKIVAVYLCLQTLKEPGNSKKSWWHGESIGGSRFKPIHVGHKPRLMASPTDEQHTDKHQKLTQELRS